MVRRNPPTLQEAAIAAPLDYTVTLPAWFNSHPFGLLINFLRAQSA
jgi:hypothetical protein